MAGTPTTTTSSLSTFKPIGRTRHPRVSPVGQKKTQAGLSTSIDDYDNYDDTDYEAIAKEIREEEDRDVNSEPLRFQETVPSSRHSSESRNLEDRQAASKSRHSRAGGNPEGQGEAPNNPPLPQGEGWGEGTAGILKNPLLPRRGKAGACPELAEGMGVNLQPYVAPDPNLQPHNRPFDKEEQAKFDEEPPPPIAPTGYPDPEIPIAGAATNGTSVICAPPAEKLRAPAIRSP